MSKLDKGIIMTTIKNVFTISAAIILAAAILVLIASLFLTIYEDGSWTWLLWHGCTPHAICNL